MTKPLVRDFIYLDVERLRSFVAQAGEGLVSERTRATEHDTGGKLIGKGKLPFLAEIEGEGNYHYKSSYSETRSLHDHIFAEFYDAFLDHEAFTDLSTFSVSDWVKGNFIDGSFLITKGRLKITDFQYAKQRIADNPRIYDAIIRLNATPEEGSNSNRRSSSNKSKGFTQETSAVFQSLRVEETAKLIDALHGDTIRVQIFPFQNGENFLVGEAIREAFRYAPALLANLYGLVIDAGWTCVVQANVGTSEYKPAQLTGATQNAYLDGLERVLDHSLTIGSHMDRVHFPAVAMTLLAIYREL